MICASNLLGYLRVLDKENEQKLGGPRPGPRPRLMVLASRAAGILGKGVWGIALCVTKQQLFFISLTHRPSNVRVLVLLN